MTTAPSTGTRNESTVTTTLHARKSDAVALDKRSRKGMASLSRRQCFFATVVAYAVLSLLTVVRYTSLCATHGTQQEQLEYPSAEVTRTKGNLPEPELLSSLDTNGDEWKRTLFERLDRIRANCGELCNINSQQALEAYSVAKYSPDDTFTPVQVNVDCDKIMLDEDVDAPDTTFPLLPVSELWPYYSMKGLVKLGTYEQHFTEQYLGGSQKRHPIWRQPMIQRMVNNIQNCTNVQNKDDPLELRKGYLNYTGLCCRQIDKYIPWEERQTMSALVIGTEIPWAEAMLLSLGFPRVTTLEYGTIESRHPKLTTITPSEMRQKYANGTLEKFDLVVSFSSLEHAGLGRYGDALNPWGDVLGVARARCVTKPNGYLALGVPTSSDSIEFNAHRIYGMYRYPLLTANWKQIDGKDHDPYEVTIAQDCMVQPTFMFQNSAVD